MLENKYNALETEKKWQAYWQEKGIYKFDKDSEKPTFSIDTPPPTVSGINTSLEVLSTTSIIVFLSSKDAVISKNTNSSAPSAL